MKLVDRERVDGTSITIGHRVSCVNGKQKVSTKYSAEFRDLNGKQRAQGLGTANKLQARRLAVELQQELEKGIEKNRPSNITVDVLVQHYSVITKAKGISPKTVDKYRTDLNKLKDFCRSQKILFARQFTETDLYLYRQYLVEKNYADKTVQGAIVLAKQVFKWAWRQGTLQHYRLEAASFPKAKANPQPCFTSQQVDMLLDIAVGEEKTAFALMGYAGLRIGEVVQLHKEDIKSKANKYTMLHIRRGGSNGTTKDRDDRFVPVHPKVAEFLPIHKNASGPLLPAITERKLLARLKRLCADCGFENPQQYKLHSFRHHFASMCANHGVAHRKALAWLGHSSSDMLDLYYHLHDEDSQNTMQALAAGSENSLSGDDEKVPHEGKLRALGESKIEETLQAPAVQELVTSLSQITERAGFEPAVQA